MHHFDDNNNDHREIDWGFLDLPPAAPKAWKLQMHGRGLWFRGNCNKEDCDAHTRLVICAPYYELGGEDVDKVIRYTWTMRPKAKNRITTALWHGKEQPKCKCCCCGDELNVIEANLTNCYFRLEGIKIVGLNQVRYQGKWTLANPRNKRNHWEQVNEVGGLHVKWHELKIHIQINGTMPVDTMDKIQSVASSGLGRVKRTILHRIKKR